MRILYRADCGFDKRLNAAGEAFALAEEFIDMIWW
jgi:hypothetical protein